jgi:hypothetical protein
MVERMHASGWRRATQEMRGCAVRRNPFYADRAGGGGDPPDQLDLHLTRREILAALAACPIWVLGGAVTAHLLPLALRTEAWRTVLAGAVAMKSTRAR